MTADIAAILAANHGPGPLPERPLRIGIVGAGGIVRAGHLPAYRSAGLPVVAIADLNRDAAQRTAAEFGIARVAGSAAELIADPEVEVVDIAVTPAAQPDIVRAAIDAGKPVLAQKPFAEDLAVAAELVARAQRAGVALAVNQQMRWDKVISCTKALLDAHWYGQPAGAQFDIDVLTDWSLWPHLVRTPRLEYFHHSIHYIDAIRHLFGEPRAVLAHIARFPGQAAAGESRTFTVFEYTDELAVTVSANHNNWSARPRAVVRCFGADGQSEGTLGSLYDYPTGRPDTFEFWSRTRFPDHTFARDFTERWIPDAFTGPMAELQRAIVERREPLTSARDNLGTLRLVHAAYRSAEQGRRVPVAEVTVSEASRTALDG